MLAGRPSIMETQYACQILARKPIHQLALLLGMAVALVATPEISSQTADRTTTSTISFLAIGDWGWDGAHDQLGVAKQMGVTGADIASQFVLSLGDNFYENGVRSVNDPQWKTSFENIYTAPVLQRRWYAVLGNHDYNTPGDPQAQIDYTHQSARWYMPARYYAFAVSVDSETKAEFFVLDTNTFVESYRSSEKKIKNLSGQEPGVQLQWLEAALAASKAAWKVVVGHHPIASGREPEKELVRDIKPLLEKYGVQVYINGHEHAMEHLKVGAIHYLCSGAAGKAGSAKVTDNTLFSLGKTPGFLAISLSADRMRASFHDLHGGEIYTASIPRS